MKITFINYNFQKIQAAEAFVGLAEAYADIVADSQSVAISLLESGDNASKTQNWLVQIILQAGDAPAFMAVVDAKFKVEHPAFEFSQIIDIIENKDWLGENRKSFPPIKLGRFYIHHLADERDRKPSLIDLSITATTAFGTGNHPTTKLCLQQLETLKKQKFSPESMVDIGCGTGILAIAAQKLWQNTLNSNIAVDIEADAVSITKNNIVKNKLLSKIKAFTGAGLPIYKIKPNQYFDLAVANILVNPLIELAPIIARRMRPKSVLILSGITLNQVRKVKNHYCNHGFTHCKTTINSGWAQITLVKRLAPIQAPKLFSSQHKIMPWII
ncbi:MAG: 50S ribosomal protein L11 methyltransferase [Alphaproteobacteria bacterium]